MVHRIPDDVRDKIISLYLEGYSKREIAKITDVSRPTVQKIIKEYKEKATDDLSKLADELERQCKRGIDEAKAVINSISHQITHENFQELAKTLMTGKMFLTVFNMKECDVVEIAKTIKQLGLLYNQLMKFQAILDRMKELEKRVEQLEFENKILSSEALWKKQYIDKIIKTMIHCNNPNVVRAVLDDIWRQIHELGRWYNGKEEKGR